MFPEPPEFTEELLRKCRERNDFRPVMFEWCGHVGKLSAVLSCILQDSAIVTKSLSPIEYAILVGLINRCSRLIGANLTLSKEGERGESTSIIDRSIFESSILLSWLCRNKDPDKFRRYIASCLKSEVELEEQVLIKIEKRKGVKLKIEERMLNSVQCCFAECGIDRGELKSIKRIPNLAQMIEELELERLAYTVGQRMGSHNVHGTWVSLRHHYIDLEGNGSYSTKSSSSTHFNQYLYVSLVVLYSLDNFVQYVIEDDEVRDEMSTMLEEEADAIKEFSAAAYSEDYGEV